MLLVNKLLSREGGKFSIRNLLHKTLPGLQDGRSVDVIHSSSLTKSSPEFCPREHVLLGITNEKPKAEFLGTSQVVTFGLGRAIQDLFNNEWLLNYMVGDWVDKTTGEVVKASKRPTKPGHWVYVEINFVSKISGASGGVDGVIDIGGPKLHMVEVKSIDKDAFISLSAPLAEHRLRTNYYLRLISESDHPLKDKIDTSKGSVIYVSKAFGVKDPTIKDMEGVRDSSFSPFKEYTVKRDDTKTERLNTLAKAVYDYRAGKVGMPRGVCRNSAVKRAASCGAIRPCWSGKYPATNNW